MNQPVSDKQLVIAAALCAGLAIVMAALLVAL
jgi:hypothetical protein